MTFTFCISNWHGRYPIIRYLIIIIFQFYLGSKVLLANRVDLRKSRRKLMNRYFKISFFDIRHFPGTALLGLNTILINMYFGDRIRGLMRRMELLIEQFLVVAAGNQNQDLSAFNGTLCFVWCQPSAFLWPKVSACLFVYYNSKCFSSISLRIQDHSHVLDNWSCTSNRSGGLSSSTSFHFVVNARYRSYRGWQ